jgi:hypothetical protein
LFEHYRRLCHLRQERPALRTELFSLDAVYPEQKSVVYHRWDEDGDEVVVAANFSPVDQTLMAPFPRPGRWCDVLSGAIVEIAAPAEGEGAASSFDLAPSAAAIFVRA